MAVRAGGDGFRPDRWDITGAVICLLGIAVIMFATRTGGLKQTPRSADRGVADVPRHHFRARRGT